MGGRLIGNGGAWGARSKGVGSGWLSNGDADSRRSACELRSCGQAGGNSGDTHLGDGGTWQVEGLTDEDVVCRVARTAAGDETGVAAAVIETEEVGLEEAVGLTIKRKAAQTKIGHTDHPAIKGKLIRKHVRWRVGACPVSTLLGSMEPGGVK